MDHGVMSDLVWQRLLPFGFGEPYTAAIHSAAVWIQVKALTVQAYFTIKQLYCVLTLQVNALTQTGRQVGGPVAVHQALDRPRRGVVVQGVTHVAPECHCGVVRVVAGVQVLVVPIRQLRAQGHWKEKGFSI